MHSKARVLYGCALLLALLVVLTSFAPFTLTNHVKAQASTRSLVYLEATDSPSAKELWVANADGSDKLRLVEKTEGMANPQWSPDGTQIAFSTEKGVSIINADGTGLRQVTDFDSGKASIAWSPDGKRIAFSGIALSKDTYGIKVINADGSGFKRYDKIAGRFTWSADPNILYVVEVVDEQKYIFGLVEFNLSTGKKRALSSLALDDFNPVISPDGTQMMLVAKGKALYTFDIYVTDLKFRNPHVVISGSELQRFGWSQDSKAILSYGNSLEILSTDIASKQTSPISDLSGFSHQWQRTQAETATSGNVVAVAPTATPLQLTPMPITVVPSNAQSTTQRVVYTTHTVFGEPGKTWIDGTTDLWIADADGSNPVRLIASGAGVSNPHWSPDGTQIAFSTYEGVHLIKADGTGLHLLFKRSGVSQLGWSPDGTQIAFTFRLSTQGRFFLAVMNSDGSDVKSYDDGTLASHFVWSADPDVLYVVEPLGASPDSGYGLFAFNLKTNTASQLTSMILDDFPPRLSPDGTQMILVAKGKQAYSISVYVSDLTFNKPRLVIYNYIQRGGDETFRWSQDGSAVIHSEFISDFKVNVYTTDLMTMQTSIMHGLTGFEHEWHSTPVLTTVLAEATDSPTATPQAELAPTAIAVQPSAEKVTPLIAYVRSDANSATPDALYISNPDGSDERVLIDASANLTIDYLAWSPDGKLLTYSASPFGSGFGTEINKKFNVYTINVEDKTIQQITDCQNGCLDAAWSPDGQEIAFSLQKIGEMGWQSDIMVRNLATGEDRLIKDGLNKAAFYTERCYSSAWSPDGQELAYLCYSGSQGDVFISNTTGTTQRQVTHNRPLAGIDDLAWSPDGRQLLFSLSGTNAYELDSGVYVVNRDGSGFREIEGFRCGRGGVTWSADGSEIFIVARRKDSQGVTIVPFIFDLIAVNPRTMAYRTVKLDIGFWVAPIPRPTNACMVTALRTVNVREGAGTDTKVVGKLEQGDTQEVVARVKGSDGRFWWQLAQGGLVREDLVSASPTCHALN